jgi:hypothetical protein
MAKCPELNLNCCFYWYTKNNWIILTKRRRRHSSPSPPLFPREVYWGCGRIGASIKIIVIDA